MRVNIYSQELTEEFAVEYLPSASGRKYEAVRLFLHSSPLLNRQPEDDTRSAVTFWLPASPQCRENFARTLESMAKAVRTLRTEVIEK